MNTKNKKWTNEEDLVIIRLRKQGKSITEITKNLNRTYGATQQRICRLINECKVQKKQISYHSSSWYINGEEPSPKKEAKHLKRHRPFRISEKECNKILQYVSESPWNIQSAFRRYSKESGIPVSAIHSLYYCRSPYRVRLKDRKTKFSVIGSTGQTIKNCKNASNPNSIRLWSKIKSWVVSSLLS